MQPRPWQMQLKIPGKTVRMFWFSGSPIAGTFPVCTSVILFSEKYRSLRVEFSWTAFPLSPNSTPSRHQSDLAKWINKIQDSIKSVGWSQLTVKWQLWLVGFICTESPFVASIPLFRLLVLNSGVSSPLLRAHLVTFQFETRESLAKTVSALLQCSIPQRQTREPW